MENYKWVNGRGWGPVKKEAETLAEEHVAPLNANLATKEDIAAVKTDIDSGNHGQH